MYGHQQIIFCHGILNEHFTINYGSTENLILIRLTKGRDSKDVNKLQSKYILRLKFIKK